MINEKTFPTSYLIHSFICVVLMLSGWLLPPIASITPLGMKVLGIFIGSVYAWCLIEFVWPSLLAMMMLGVSGYSTISGVFSAGFGDIVVLQCMFTFIFIKVMDEVHLTDWLAGWFLSRKICNGHPWTLTLMILYAAIIVGGFINLYGGILMLWAIFYSICKKFGFQKGNGYVVFMISAMMFLGAISAMFLPFLPLPLIICGVTAKVVPNLLIPYTAWMGLGIFLTVLFPLLFTFTARFIFRFDLSQMASINMSEFISMAKMNKEQKFAGCMLILFVAILILPNVVPEGAFKSLLASFGVLGAAISAMIILCCRRNAQGERITNFNTMAAKGLNWDIVIMFAATMPISAALESPDCGILSTILGALLPFFQQLGGIAFVVLTFICLTLVTQVAHNLVIMIAVLPTLAGVCVSLGISPVLYVFLLSILLQAAFVTPGASAQAALVFGQTAWLSSKSAMFYGTVYAILTLLVVLILAFPIGLVLF